MKVIVITPYHVLDDQSDLCIDSVENQSYDNVQHILIADGCEAISNKRQLNPARHMEVILPKNINDFGDTPRSIAVIYAGSLGADAVLFLDSDNWLDQHHVKTMVEVATKTKSELVVCKRKLCMPDGEVLGICKDSNGIVFSDTNCMFVTKKLFSLASTWWDMPSDFHELGDRVVWNRMIQATNKVAVVDIATVNYRISLPVHYRMFNRKLPVDSRPDTLTARQVKVIKQLAAESVSRIKLIKPLFISPNT